MSGRKKVWILVLGVIVAVPARSQDSTPPAAEQKEQKEKPVTETIPLPVENEEAPAADQGATQLESIEVTSDKRVKAQRDIPGSVGAIRGQDLEKMRAQGMKDYLKLVPGVLYPDEGNEEAIPVIRGVATSIGGGALALGATAATVGVYMDDMPFGDLFKSWSVPDLNPFDLERVEVLKGPQGTLFGSGALSGAVRYIVQKPEFGVWQAKGMATMASTDQGGGISPTYGGAVNVPLFGDAAALRAVYLDRSDKGVYDMGAHDANGNTLRNDPDADRLTQRSWRALGSWNITDEFKASVFWFNQKTHQHDFGLTERTDQPVSDKFPYPSPRDHDFSGGNLSLTYDFPWLRALSSSNLMRKHNYIDQHLEAGFGLENKPGQEYDNAFADDVKGYTQEIRLMSPEGAHANWEWLVGGSVLHFPDKGFQYSYLGPTTSPDPTSVDQISDAQKNAAQVFSTIDQVAGETALFGEVTGRLGEHFEATLGGRQYATSLRADTLVCGVQIAALFQQPCYPQHFDDTTKGFNPKASIRYLHSRNVQLYVLAAKGFQFGGLQVNPPAPGFATSAQQAGYPFGPYKSSNLWNYELGVRTEWLDRRVRFDTTFFYLDWTDLQVTVEVKLAGNVPFAVVANVGRAHSEGVESALEVLPFAGAKVTTSVALTHAVTDVLFDQGNADGGVKPGTALPGAPRVQWASAFAYEHALPYFTSWSLGPSLTATYTGTATDAIRPNGLIGGYATLDGRLDFLQPSSKYQPEISFGVNNLTNARGIAFLYGGTIATATPGSPSSYTLYHFAQPRTAVLSVSLRY